MKLQNRYDRWLVVGAAMLLVLHAAVRVAKSASGPSLFSTMQFQRVVDTPSPGPFGTLSLTEKGGKQTFSVDIKNLFGQSFGVYVGTNFTFDTNSVLFIAPLNLTTNGRWKLQYQSVGGAPPQLTSRIPGLENLDEMAGLFIFIANPAGTTNFSDCVTNIIDCTTNIVGDVTNIDCVTSIDNCVTNPIVASVLVAEVPPLVSAPGLFNFKGKTNMFLPDVPPNPKAKGFISEKFAATKGSSLLDIRATSLFGGQTYSLWISTNAGGPVVTNLVQMTQTNSPTMATFRRNSALGDQLPFAVTVVTNLSGFNIEIRDAFDTVHLKGTIP